MWNPELVKSSYEELKRFVRFIGQWSVPTIIGGWAVYFYNPYSGSIDIDVVGRGYKGDLDVAITKFEEHYHYTPKDVSEDARINLGLNVVLFKRISDNQGNEIPMEIDCCTFENEQAKKFSEDPNKELPYSLCEKEDYRNGLNLGGEKNCFCFLPRKELLFLFKMKASRDRAHNLQLGRATMNPTRRAWLEGKVRKDRTDMIALLDPSPSNPLLVQSIDPKLFHKISTLQDLDSMVQDSLEKLNEDDEAVTTYGKGLTREMLKTWIAQLSN
jgi:hypothetical protein